MSFDLVKAARATRAPCRTSKSVLLYLAERAGRAGDCWPAIRMMQDDLQVSRSTVKRSLRALVAAGLIDVQERTRGEDGGRTSSLYRLLIALRPPVQDGPPPVQNDPPPVQDGPPPGSPMTHREQPLEPLLLSSTVDKSEREPEPEPDLYPVDPEPAAMTAEVIPIAVRQDPSAARRAKAAARRMPTAMPEDFAPDEATTRLIREIGLTVRQVHDAMDQMRDWHAANGQRKCDWQATLRGWIRRDRERRGPLRLSGPGTQPAGVVDAAAEAMRIIRERYQA